MTLSLVLALSFLCAPFSSLYAAAGVGALAVLLAGVFARWKSMGQIVGLPCLLFAGIFAAWTLWLVLSSFLLPESGYVLWGLLSLLPIVVLTCLRSDALNRTANLLAPVWSIGYLVLIGCLTAKYGEFNNLSLYFNNVIFSDFLPLLWTTLAAQSEKKPKNTMLSALCGVLVGLLGQFSAWLILRDYPAKTLLPALRLNGAYPTFWHLNALSGLLFLPALLLSVAVAARTIWDSRKAFKKGAAVALCLCLLPLSGCDGAEPDEQIFALNMAIDIGQSNDLRLTMQYPQITPVGKSDEEGGSELQKDGYQIEQTEGETLADCLTTMRLITPRKVSLLQLRGVFFGESLVSDPALFGEIVEYISESEDFRGNALVFVTRGRAEDVLSSQVPQFGARLSKSHAAQKKVLVKTGVVVETSLLTFLKAEREGRAPVLTLAAVNNQQYIDDKPDKGKTATGYEAGDLPRYAVARVDYCGSAILCPQQPLLLTGYETQLFNLLRGELTELNGARVHKKPRILEENGAYVCEIALSGENTDKILEDIGDLLYKFEENGVMPFAAS